MKKKVKSFLMAFALVLPCLFLVACDDDKTNALQKEIDTLNTTISSLQQEVDALQSQLESPQSYGIVVGGVLVTEENASNIQAGVSYDAEKNVLTLNNAIIVASDYGIYAGRNLNINLIGENSITVESTTHSAVGILAYSDGENKNIAIQGNGALNITLTSPGKTATGLEGNQIELVGGEYNINITSATFGIGIAAQQFEVIYADINILISSNVEMANGALINTSTRFYSSDINIEIGGAEYNAAGISSNDNLNIYHSNVLINVGNAPMIAGIEAEGNVLVHGEEGVEPETIDDLIHPNSNLNYGTNILINLGFGEEVCGIYADDLTIENAFVQILAADGSDEVNGVFAKNHIVLELCDLYVEVGDATYLSCGIYAAGNLISSAYQISSISGAAEESYGAVVINQVCLNNGWNGFSAGAGAYASIGLYTQGSVEIIEANVGFIANTVSEAIGESYGVYCFGIIVTYHDFFATGHDGAILASDVKVMLENYVIHHADECGLNIDQTLITEVVNPTSFDFGAYKYIFVIEATE